MVRKPGAPQDHATITLSDVLITSYKQSAGEDKTQTAAGYKGMPAGPSEEVSFNYARIEFSYATGAAFLKTGWDMKTNTAIK